MASRLDILNDIQNKLLPDFVQFRDFLRMVLPKTEEDKVAINLFIDMLSDIITDIESAEDLSDLSDWFKIPDLVNDWDTISNSIATKYSTPVQNFIEAVTNSYVIGLNTRGGIEQ